jgi:hypothetical protein
MHCCNSGASCCPLNLKGLFFFAGFSESVHVCRTAPFGNYNIISKQETAENLLEHEIPHFHADIQI